ncbi:hypothetical protein Calhy_1863 [Caldicellulosiruptor hydrothermalis 108]|uniref:Uncharacterized protein n=1 Tax=Caldicellulosiruptor hydrothermalis (strain DSM 18901 / VKM B-2411 / 108) TaxID=632292 RepID=E4QDF5_CALH1|nr:hypothetical protein Calhy_1863 [Caldicellulosiruptor hydrothermalis 108]
MSFLKLLIFVICLLLIIFVGIDNIWFSLLFSFCILIVFHVSIGAFYLQSPPILQTPNIFKNKKGYSPALKLEAKEYPSKTKF